MNMDIRRIEYFLELAETLSFTKAAEKLCITPQALTKQIFEIEKETGAKLFERSTRKVTLTAQGEICYRHFAGIMRAYRKEMKNLQDELKGYEDKIRIGFFDALPRKTVLDSVLAKIREHHPYGQLELHAGSLHHVRSMLIEHEIDLAITLCDRFEYAFWKKYDVLEIRKSRAYIAVGKNHPWAGRTTPVTWEEMEEASVIMLNDPYHVTGDGGFYSEIPHAKTLQVDNFQSMLVSLYAGKDFAVFPQMFEGADNTELCYLELPAELENTFSLVAVSDPDNVIGCMELDFLRND